MEERAWRAHLPRKKVGQTAVQIYAARSSEAIGKCLLPP